MRSLVLYLFIIFSIATLSGQVKYEKEYRLRPSEVPQIALDFVQSLGLDGKIKWYKEEGLNRTSYEAKTKHISKRYSIEFDIKGNIEDVEIQIRKNDIPVETFSGIQSYTSKNYGKFKMCKIQKQLIGESRILISSIKNQTVHPDVIVNYEVVAKVQDKSGRYEAEFLFDVEGKFIRKDRIVQKNTDNLEY